MITLYHGATAVCAAKVRMARRSALRRRPSYRLLDIDELPGLFPVGAGTEMAAEAARLRDMHPSDVAGVVRALPLAQRKQLAEAMDDERLADLLEELPEAEQLRIIEGLDIERMVNVLEEMEYDDLADLLAEMPGEQRTRVLDAMDEEDADVMRRLLSYDEGTAGALMTPDIVVMGPTATVAEALAEIRDPEWLVSIAAQVYVVQPPYKPPITNTNNSSGAQTSFNPSNRCPHVVAAPRGNQSGLTRTITVMVNTYMAMASMPGKMPAMNNLPMSCWVRMA